MKKIVFLGCENSHSAMFLEFIKTNPKYSDIEVLGVYSYDEVACKNLNEKYGVPILENYDSMVGKVDGVVITARHGDNHYKYAKPYIEKGVTLFLDKPITISETEAQSLMKECKEKGAKITGGSCLRFEKFVNQIANEHLSNEDGATLGGFIRCPVSLENEYGGFYFYAQHLVEAVLVAFGRSVKSVYAKQNGKTLQVMFNYSEFTVCGTFSELGFGSYYLARLTENKVTSGDLSVDSFCFNSEWEEFYNILSGANQVADFKEFISPVFVMNAIYRSMQTKREEIVKEYEV
jgi:hypothetical protein